MGKLKHQTWDLYVLDSSQLAAPRNPKIHLYNAEQILRWEPSSPGNDTVPVTYRVQFKYTGSNWSDFESPEVNCTQISATECKFATATLSEGFPKDFNVSLRVRAELGQQKSAWAAVPWFQHFRNATIGPPENIVVTPGGGSLIVTFSAPFDTGNPRDATFSYYVHYWEKGGTQQARAFFFFVRDPVKSNSILLNNLKPFTVYCLQVQARLFWTRPKIINPGDFSNTFCEETTADASTKLQQIILISMGTFSLLLVLTGACFFLVLKYQGLIKYWFHTPPSIPSQIEEYLKDPAQPILEVLDKDSSPKDDVWDSVSVISFPEKEGEDMEPKHGSSWGTPEVDAEQGS
ncbi:Interferon-gamma receptor beta chain [Heterocephalus glaber]|uniref:Interferon-gamma receptor beta chain n=1 Tax=Heterocephalus glaber TaxID=10181 RepID=G5BE89_HETGA|nr:Interferon-gamma receptor beta chain [Heterocephalus glaber]